MTAAAIGDIVQVPYHRDDYRWVVASVSTCSPSGCPHARLVRPTGQGSTAHTTHAKRLTVIDRPAFEVGQRVSIDSRTGTILEFIGDSARVEFDPVRVPLRGGGYLLNAGRSDVPLWRLTLERM